jgi:hypothetical protein
MSAIAEAFDRHQERLDGFVEREQMFTSAAAHELRTPLRGDPRVERAKAELGARSLRSLASKTCCTS